MKIKQTLKLLAPYFAVGIFWCVFSSAWLAILAYHAQILFWSWKSIPSIRKPDPMRIMLLALPAAVAGPLLYFLLPHITHTDLPVWLVNHHLSGLSLVLMIPYFGLFHPFLEQIHWVPLRETTPLAHPLFAGYHVMVLCSLLTLPWLIICFIVLTATSFMWQQMIRRTGSLAIPVASHILADIGIVMVAWLKS